VCVVLTPLVLAVVVEARLPALPYLLALSTAANVGGVVSFSGNPQNMIVGAAAHGSIGFAQYLALTLPIGVIALAVNAAILAWLFRHELPTGPLADRSPPRPAVDKKLATKGLVSLALFAGLALAGVTLAGAAMCAAATLMVLAGTGARQVFTRVDWTLLAFFGGLFVVVAGVAHAGVLQRVFDAVAPVVARGDTTGDLAFIALVVIASNVVSNVPLVLIAVAWIPHMPEPTWGYVMLAVASTLAGNLTLFGSIANIIVMETAGPRGEVSFWRFLRYGSVITIIDLAIAFGILALVRAIGFFSLLGL
jgi:Na+/H+ antiporter NhaD/arsenite permease-like protein